MFFCFWVVSCNVGQVSGNIPIPVSLYLIQDDDFERRRE